MAIKAIYSWIYIGIVSLTGIFGFLINHPDHFRETFNSVNSLVFLGAILLLTHYAITFPPNKNNVSMDSAIFLAILYLYGLEFTLNVLLLHGIFYTILKMKIAWWKHIFNFSNYALMITFAYFIFIQSGGEVGSIQTSNLLSYILSLSSYFFVNLFVTSIYYFLSRNESFKVIISEITSDKTFLISYLFTLLFSIVLGILIEHDGILGLFLFVCIAMLLSFAFNQHFLLFQDVSNRAKKDYLTGLNNHGSFKELLEAEVSLARKMNRPLSIALIDLDDFKKYNDLNGHIQGDYLLSIFGKSLNHQASSTNFISARYGGEEFAILMPNTVSLDAYFFIDKFRKRVNNICVEGVEILPFGCLSFSAGIVELENGTNSASELLNQADIAMYFSKAHGKNMVQIYHESLEENSSLSETELMKVDHV